MFCVFVFFFVVLASDSHYFYNSESLSPPCRFINLVCAHPHFNHKSSLGAENFEERGLVEGAKEVPRGPSPERHSCPVGEGRP